MRPRLVIQSRRDSAVRVPATGEQGSRIQHVRDVSQITGVAAISPPKPCPAATPYFSNTPRSTTRPGLTLGVAAISPQTVPCRHASFLKYTAVDNSTGFDSGVAAISPPNRALPPPHFSNTPRPTTRPGLTLAWRQFLPPNRTLPPRLISQIHRGRQLDRV